MTRWRTLPDERTRMFSPVGLLPRDDMTGRAPVGTLRAFLDLQESGGTWRPTDVPAVTTAAGVITYPALGRQRAPLGQPPRHYRVRVVADHYVPRYPVNPGGFEFDAFPYDDDHPPQSVPAMPQPLDLLPGPTYPFPGHLLVLRGVVRDAASLPVADAEVWIGTTSRTYSDARGVFALALARPIAAAVINVDASDPRNAHVGSAAVQFPLGLVRNVQITIP